MANNIQKLFCVVIAILLTTEQVNSQNSVYTFDITNFDDCRSSIIIQGSARISGDGTLELSDFSEYKLLVGRGLHKTPVAIWDRTTGNVASFVTKFTFVLEDMEPSKPVGGEFFFFIGLAAEDTRYVAVKFNEYDPNYVGIDVNTFISLKTATWKRVSGAEVEVTIAYDSISKILTVAVTDRYQFLTVSQVVDSKKCSQKKLCLVFLLPQQHRPINYTALNPGLLLQI